MIQAETPSGLPVHVPENVSEDTTRRFQPQDTREARKHLKTEGFCVVSGIFSAEQCDTARRLWASEVKPFGGPIYRQTTGRAERHRFNDQGWVMNPMLNVQSIDPRRMGGFRSHARGLLADERLGMLLTVLLDGPPTIIQSMYFEGNSATWEHQDSYYLDSERAGTMVAAWIALEDIAEDAGRFFVCPGSHLFALDHAKDNNYAEHHDRYIAGIVETIREQGSSVCAPALSKGDVLFWHAHTVHGSLKSSSATNTRSSITCHAIRTGDRMLQFQSRTYSVPGHSSGQTTIYAPKDLRHFRNQVALRADAHFPRAFGAVKRHMIKRLILRNEQP